MSLDVDGDYFLIHHTPADTVDKIDPKDMSRAAAAIAVMAYVVAEMPERLRSDFLLDCVDQEVRALEVVARRRQGVEVRDRQHRDDGDRRPASRRRVRSAVPAPKSLWNAPLKCTIGPCCPRGVRRPSAIDSAIVSSLTHCDQ